MALPHRPREPLHPAHQAHALRAGETLRAALQALAAAAPQWLAGQVAADWVERYGARIDSYRFPKGENVRQKWAEQVGRDGFTILETVFSPAAPGWLRQTRARGPGP